MLAAQLDVPERLIHINAGSELILRQIFDRFGQQAHLLTPTYPLFPEIARSFTETRLSPEHDFTFDLGGLEVPDGTTLVVIVNPNNPNTWGKRPTLPSSRSTRQAAPSTNKIFAPILIATRSGPRACA